MKNNANKYEITNKNNFYNFKREIIVLIYSAADESSFPMNKIWTVVSYSGKVHWSPPTKLISRCSLNLSEWPWDSHICDIKLGLFDNQELIEILLSSIKVSILH
jgi:hypothetical protein